VLRPQLPSRPQQAQYRGCQLQRRAFIDGPVDAFLDPPGDDAVARPADDQDSTTAEHQGPGAPRSVALTLRGRPSRPMSSCWLL
jgi:hypothetical protein